MAERFPSAARRLRERASRRQALLGMSVLALGSLGLIEAGPEAAARTRCNRCTFKCKQKNERKSNDKNKTNCRDTRRNSCRK